MVFCSQKNWKRYGVRFSSLAAMPLFELERGKRGEIKHQHVKSHVCECSSSLISPHSARPMAAQFRYRQWHQDLCPILFSNTVIG